MAQVLIVDDQSDIRRLLKISLGKACEILESEDGMSALEMIRHHRPKVVLLDIMMPGELNGLQVLQAAKADPHTRDVVIGIMSARGESTDFEAADALGADAYFVKPFSPIQVVSWVREQIE